MVRNIKNSNKGFTLIELLVVVAIIGILATAGIPQYRRMVAKSKQSEAKVALGEVATAQAAFFSEYGAYGNNLRMMGVQSDIADGANNVVAAMVAGKIYIYGYLSTACAADGGAVVPAIGTSWGDQINAQIPDYQADYQNNKDAAGAANDSSVAFGRMTRSANCSAAAVSAIPDVATSYSTYTVVASGVIKPGQSLDAPTAAADSDVWSVNQSRIITNNQTAID